MDPFALQPVLTTRSPSLDGANGHDISRHFASRFFRHELLHAVIADLDRAEPAQQAGAMPPPKPHAISLRRVVHRFSCTALNALRHW